MSEGENGRKGVSISADQPNTTLRFLYNTACGRLFLRLLKRRGASKLVGKILNSRASRCLNKRFCKSNNIDLKEAERTELSLYNSYNDVFTRNLRASCRPIDMSAEHLISPCDGKLTAYTIDDNSSFFIKGGQYSLTDLLGDEALAEQFKGGVCLIFRLAVGDYHRYCYVDDGKLGQSRCLGSELHTVQNIALSRYNIYKRNLRVCTVMQTKNFGSVVQVEVGAMVVGRINNHNDSASFVRGAEKGLFELGGSTIVLLLKKDAAVIDEDILQNTAENKETPVRMGERIGLSNFAQ